MKKYVCIFLCISLCLLLTACHGTRNTQAFEVPDALDESREFEITFWAKNDTNKAQTDIYQSAIDSFEALYPNIHINMRLYTDYGKIYNDVITNISTGTTPNVCITYPDHIATYITGSNVVAPLDALFADEKYGFGGSELKFESPTQDEIVARYLSEGVLDGVSYAIPFMRSTEACYINKTYVEALGFELPEVLTWDFIWEVSEAATEKNEDGTFKLNGQKVLIPFIYKSTDNMMIQMLHQQNAGYSTDAGEVLIFNDTTKQDLLTIASHVSSGAFSTFKISGYPANFLCAGQCIFAVDSTAGSTWMGTGAPMSDISADKVVEFETAVMTVPQYDSENVSMISQGPSICVFNKDDPQEVLASWLFAQYLLTDDIQISYAETEGYVPVTTRARENAEYVSYLNNTDNDDAHYSVKLAATKLLLEHTEDTFVTPVFNGSTSLRDAAGQMIESVTKSVRRKQTVDDAYIETLYADVTSLYRLDQLETTSDGEKDLGPLPQTAVILIAALCVTWVILGAYALRNFIRRKRNAK